MSFGKYVRFLISISRCFLSELNEYGWPDARVLLKEIVEALGKIRERAG
jgi:hypothetical protein